MSLFQEKLSRGCDTALSNLAAILFCLGFLTVTWDKILIWDIAGFNLRISQPIFFSSFLLTAWIFKSEWKTALANNRFFLLTALLVAFYLAGSPWSYFPFKSFAYSLFLLFNLLTIGVNAFFLTKAGKFPLLLAGAFASLLFHSAVIIVDQIAFQFGHVYGFIGFNQNEIVKWGVSRPHAFAYEPSYIAAFLCFGVLLLAPFASNAFAKRPLRVILSSTAILYALVATTSRTGWLGLALGLCLMAALQTLKEKAFPLKSFSGIALVLGSVVAIFYLSTPSAQRQAMDQNLVSSVVTLSDGSGNHRLRVFKYALTMAKDTYFFGTGLGASYKYWAENGHTYESIMHGGFTPQSYGYEVVMSVWGQLLAEGGLIALAIYFAAATAICHCLWKRWQLHASPLVLGGLVSALTWYLFIAFWMGNVARGDVWVWMALWVCLAYSSEKEISSGEDSKSLYTEGQPR